MASLARLSIGEKISAVSAILLYVFMSFDWYDIEVINNSNLLFYLRVAEPGQSAWEALDVIAVVLLLTIVSALAVAVLRSLDAIHRPLIPVNAVVASLGSVSALLILFRIVDPPNFGSEEITQFKGAVFLLFEGSVQLPMFLGLLAAGGIAFGGCLAMREEGLSLSDLRVRRGGAHG